MLLVMILYGSPLSSLAVLPEEWTYHKYPESKSIVVLFCYALTETFWYRIVMKWSEPSRRNWYGEIWNGKVFSQKKKELKKRKLAIAASFLFVIRSFQTSPAEYNRIVLGVLLFQEGPIFSMNSWLPVLQESIRQACHWNLSA